MTRLSLVTRRRFLTLSAAAALLPCGAKAEVPLARWRGRALGAPASMHIAGLSATQAAPIFDAMARELKRLEAIFSLYHEQSEIVRLNRHGALDAPSPEMLELLSLCKSLNTATDGAFDPTIQPIWQALTHGRTPQGHTIGLAHVDVNNRRIAFRKPGMAITLNGIAQGYVTDRIAALLQAHGLRDVLVDMGEIVARGGRREAPGWRAGIVDPNRQMLRRLTLSDRALATSAPEGFVLDQTTQQGHILHPGGGSVQNALISVSAPSAALADGLSTALCLIEAKALDQVVAQFPETRLEMRL